MRKVVRNKRKDICYKRFMLRASKIEQDKFLKYRNIDSTNALFNCTIEILSLDFDVSLSKC